MFRIYFVLLAALGLAACGMPPEFSHPLGQPLGSQSDHKRLAGVWVAFHNGKKDGAMIIYLRSDGKGGLLVNLITAGTGSEKRKVFWWRGTAFASRIDGELYVNFRRIKGKGDDYTAPGLTPGYSVVKVDFETKDLVRVWLMNNFRVRDLIEQGRLKGRKVMGQFAGMNIPYSRVSNGPGDLRRLLLEVGSGLMSTDGHLFRRSPPP
jgi:hypothetical protein